jgi:hypothetical protein
MVTACATPKHFGRQGWHCSPRQGLFRWCAFNLRGDSLSNA